MLTTTQVPAIEAACTPIVWRALQRVGIYGACATARHTARKALGLTVDFTPRGMVDQWAANPIDTLPPLAAGPQLWSDGHDD